VQGRNPVRADELGRPRLQLRHELLGTDEATILASSAGTDGALFAVEILMRPGGGPPVMRRHEPGEVYHVTAGDLPSTSATGRTAPAMEQVLRLAAQNGITLLGPVPTGVV